MPRSSGRVRAAWGATAAAAGAGVALLVRGAPGLAGAGLVCYGLYAAWRPLGWVAAGVFLLLLDRRTS